VGKGEWSGVTWFFHKDANREAGLPRMRFGTKRYDSREDKEGGVCGRLGLGRREALGNEKSFS